MALRADSTLDVPEPELAVVANSAGEIVGYTVCNDMSSRSIEGENPLYLPQAKIYSGACSVATGIRPAWEVDTSDLAITMRVLRDGEIAYEGETSTARLHRTLEELVATLFEPTDFPDGAVLSTGTGIVPEMSFTLTEGDVVEIEIAQVGTLTNPVVRGREPMTWLRRRAGAARRQEEGAAVSPHRSRHHRRGAGVRSGRGHPAPPGRSPPCVPPSAPCLLRAAADALDAAADELVPLAIEESSLPEGRLTGRGRPLQRPAAAVRRRAGGGLLPRGHHRQRRRGREARAASRTCAACSCHWVRCWCSRRATSRSRSRCPAATPPPRWPRARPVVLKAHPGHPALSRRTGEVLAEALRAAGAPEGTFAVIHGMEVGTTALTDPRIKAAAFTGSVKGGRALLDIATTRAEPIPFYGELGSLNPVFVTSAAVAARGDAIADGLRRLVHARHRAVLHEARPAVPPGGPRAGGADRRRRARHRPGGDAQRPHPRGPRARARPARGPRRGAHPRARRRERRGVAPTLLATTAKELLADPDALLQECFGPTSIIVEYAGQDELLAAAEAFGGNLTATVHAEDGDAATLPPLLDVLRERTGRLVYNGWPTGVAVAWAMHHGGPYPATTASVHTSVGATAVRRFLRPVCYQDTPTGPAAGGAAGREPAGPAAADRRRADPGLTRGVTTR